MRIQSPIIVRVSVQTGCPPTFQIMMYKIHIGTHGCVDNTSLRTPGDTQGTIGRTKDDILLESDVMQ